MLEFALIVDNSILYCSNPNAYPKFEIICIINQLIKNIADARPWALHKVLVQPTASFCGEKILIRKFLSQNQATEMILCLVGEFNQGADFGYELIDGIFQNLNDQFCIDHIKENFVEKESKIKDLCDLLSPKHLGNAYEDFMNSQAKSESYIGPNKLIYSGISTNGLPIISQMHDGHEIFRLDTEDKKLLMTSILSGQLATIAMNAYVLAGVYLDSIEVKISSHENRFLFFHFAQFGYQNMFTLECISTGTPDVIWGEIRSVIPQLLSQHVYQKAFEGNLKEFTSTKALFKQILS
jgi:hypothetical protein